MPGSESVPADPWEDNNLELGGARAQHALLQRIIESDALLDVQGPIGKVSHVIWDDDKAPGSMNIVSTAPEVVVQFRTLTLESRVSTVAPGKSSDADYFTNIEFHKSTPDGICKAFNVDPAVGLENAVQQRRRQKDGPNIVTQAKPKHLWKILGYLFGGFCSVLWVGVLTFFLCWRPLSDPPSATNLALAILVIFVIFLQASFSAFQDWSTHKVMSSILNLMPSECAVLRDGGLVRVPATDLVRGDIVSLSSGNKVPADLRLIEASADARFDRSILTGESEEVDGRVDMTDPDFLESKNIALMGTHMTNGSAKGIVILTGARTVMGRISKITATTAQKETLIQQEINRFVRIIVLLTVVLATTILLSWVGWLRVTHFSFINVVGILVPEVTLMGCVVAFIPEGMPMGVTSTLSLIARRMKEVNVLPKSLATVETLGCVNVICSDKTGTLTQNAMQVTAFGFADGTSHSVPSEGFNRTIAPMNEALNELFKAAALCNEATFDRSHTSQGSSAQSRVNGNATDAAILRFAESIASTDSIRATNIPSYSVPFNSKNKWMLRMFGSNFDADSASEFLVYVKGAPDVVLPACASYWSSTGNKVVELSDGVMESAVALQEKWSRNGFRVIALCSRRYSPHNALDSNALTDELTSKCFRDLTLVGMIAIIDPPRPETKQTVADCRRAGMRFFMVTGDFGLTAAAIGRMVGILTHEGEPHSIMDISEAVKESKSVDENGFVPASLVLEGKHIGDLTDAQWDVVCRYSEIVFARTTPEQKLTIVNQFKSRDCVVAVTGDGVNDAPALKAAHVGIAISTGSDVAIEAATLVLLGTFDSITTAVRLGRLVFQNLQKVISYLLPAGSWSEIWPVLLNIYFGVPLPLSSFLMIIICVFTDLFLSLALIMEREEFDLLSLPPRNHKRDHLINLKIYLQSYLFIGTMMTVISHGMFFLYFWRYAGIPMSALFFAYEDYQDGFYGYTSNELVYFNTQGQCVYFVTLVILQLGNLLSVRNKRRSILQSDPVFKKPNPWIFVAAFIALAIAIFVTEVPWIQNLFGTAPVPVEFWILPIPFAIFILFADEMRKLCVRLWPNGFLAKVAW
ncbi:hypothetical protein HDU93_006124 [Gonapodya sp. JEL0774]|nr:hypothetical protein HDU93_006124 [Gonapodya sp. JEL0774]